LQALISAFLQSRLNLDFTRPSLLAEGGYMAEKLKVGCARPTGGPVGEPVETKPSEQPATVKKEVARMIKVGSKAPDFEAPAYHNGDFVSVKLSDYLGKWVVLCFYPGDFTFV
jgi:hypothetical protein